MIRIALMLGFLLAGQIAGAVEPGEQLADPALESRARAISAELRCLVCQNQSIDDSDAPLARDLRLLVRQQLLAGETDEGIRAFLVARYGEFVLLRPRFGAATALLWSTPILVLIIGGVVAARHFRSAPAQRTEPLSADEEMRLARTLAPEQVASPAENCPKINPPDTAR